MNTSASSGTQPGGSGRRCCPRITFLTAISKFACSSCIAVLTSSSACALASGNLHRLVMQLHTEVCNWQGIVWKRWLGHTWHGAAALWLLRPGALHHLRRACPCRAACPFHLRALRSQQKQAGCSLARPLHRPCRCADQWEAAAGYCWLLRATIRASRLLWWSASLCWTCSAVAAAERIHRRRWHTILFTHG